MSSTQGNMKEKKDENHVNISKSPRIRSVVGDTTGGDGSGVGSSGTSPMDVACTSPSISEVSTPKQGSRRSSLNAEIRAREASAIRRSTKMTEFDNADPVCSGGDGNHVGDSNIKARAMPKRNLPIPKDPTRCSLFCCFYAEFDNIVGPMVCFQSPRGFMAKEIQSSLEKIQFILGEEFQFLQEQSARDSESSTDASEVTSRTEAGSPSRKMSTELKSNLSHATPSVVLGENNLDNPFDAFSGVTISEGSMSIFDSCSEYIITGKELTGNIVSVSAHNLHILTRPTVISDERYERNSLLFCVGFVLRRTEDPRPFRPVLSKLATVLQDMEIESQFLSSSRTRPHLQSILESILMSLDSERVECNLYLNQSNVLNLKLFHPPKLPANPVPDFAVPLLLRRDWQYQMYDWDLSINWVLLHIDGITNARQISRKAEVDMEMVRACLRVLKHHGVIALVDMFFYSNRYESTDKAAALWIDSSNKDNKLLNAAVEYVIKCSPSTSHHHANYETSPTSLVGISPTSRGFDHSNEYTHNRWHCTNSSQCSLDQGGAAFRRDEYRDVRLAIAELYCLCQRDVSFGDLTLRLLTTRPGLDSHARIDWNKVILLIDHRRFASFGLVHGLLRRVHCFPVLLGGRGGRGAEPDMPSTQTSLHDNGSAVVGPFPIIHLSHPFYDRSSAGTLSRIGLTRHGSINSGAAMGSLMLEYHRKLASQLTQLLNGRHCDDELASLFERPFEDLLEFLRGKIITRVYSTRVIP